MFQGSKNSHPVLQSKRLLTTPAPNRTLVKILLPFYPQSSLYTLLLILNTDEGGVFGPLKCMGVDLTRGVEFKF